LSGSVSSTIHAPTQDLPGSGRTAAAASVYRRKAKYHNQFRNGTGLGRRGPTRPGRPGSGRAEV